MMHHSRSSTGVMSARFQLIGAICLTGLMIPAEVGFAGSSESTAHHFDPRGSAPRTADGGWKTPSVHGPAPRVMTPRTANPQLTTPALCTSTAGPSITGQSRWSAYNFGYEAVGERYGGAGTGYGCWINDDVPQLGEGADCSGLAGRAWFLPAFTSGNGNNPTNTFQLWPRLRPSVFYHPSSDFYLGVTENNTWKAAGALDLMDLGAKSGHVVLFVANAGNGQYTVLEETSAGAGVGRLDTRSFGAEYQWRTRKGWNA